ncbi:hypothetical protein SSU98_1217 [Streptococcus suis 98HAH33]|nr:hypothetical protein SSU05_1203 [Streptococcus suis 05ZYH33]ABP92375.1 hypothetical protein SSU98_1217 [Streptococcus suis 98HAH33]
MDANVAVIESEYIALPHLKSHILFAGFSQNNLIQSELANAGSTEDR